MNNKNILWLDFETYSETNIKVVGGYNYCIDESTNIICLGFALNDEPVQLWNPSKIMPQRILDHIENGGLFYAHNAVFDFRIWNNCGVRDLNWPEVNIAQVVDTSAVCASFSIPLSLDDAGKAMNISMPKSAEGKALIKLLCNPNKKGEQPMPFMSEYREPFQRFFKYCIRDVEAMREIIQTLPRNHLIPQEQEIWNLTYNFNSVGLPVAFDEAKCIRETIDKYVETKIPELYTITDGLVTTVNQHARIKKFCIDNKYPMKNTQAGTITEALADPNCTGAVRDLLTLRSEIGSSATAKFKKLIGLASYGELDSYWVFDNLVYHGAGPGRWTGRGFQMHNLPRAKVPNPDELIELFMLGLFIGNPVKAGKALIRPMIKAPKGFKIMVSDYSSIENRILAWFALDEATLEDFRQSIDQYITMAAARYRVSYDEIKQGIIDGVGKFKAMRQMGKVIILGCGYMMGWKTFIKTAKQQFGMVIIKEEALEAVSSYRSHYYLIKKLWNELKLAATRAVITGERHSYGRVTFGTSTVKNIRWLAMLLPSGKCIYYKNPRIDQKYIPDYEHMGKVPTITHEGRNPYTKKWTRLALTPGRLTENAVQGFAREVMAKGMLNVQERMPEVIQIGTVHDESLSLVPDYLATEETLQEFNYNLCDIPFAKGCPLAAEGYISNRYKKD